MGTTAWFGVIGYPVEHSVSPAMMNAAFRALSLDAVYLAFPVPAAALQDAVLGLRALGASGVNITIPHKQSVIPFVSEQSPEAKLAGAVNTLAFHKNGVPLYAHNTDVEGWWRSVEPALQPGWQRAAVIGAGGAARAVLAALALNAPTCQVTVVGRDRQKTAVLAADFAARLDIVPAAWEQRAAVIDASDLVVNATSVGMWPHVDACPVDTDGGFHPGQVVQDMVYAPLRTRWLEMAAGRGAATVDGLGMLVGQGAAAFQLWTGQEAPVSVMRRAAMDALRARGQLPRDA
ncbi:shikimate dehydrogenase [Alicyclobacillus cycloheptanicus]|jgi:shikimate dehydrogenase|uniref:Shikimate dehydrogenase (NADP(+)) n=1 Tax=Alicyclobacillus cycloheptanicus TaxID=1457 RepID=A0ABT9XK52_9BACL|nr:shikimate dehydrogenase [Alicyclobacillus cycloheptanicus]MDQ0190505.1 shikimate dehydrogenase [Alicyclobacillus cycloheptanicus]WDM00733.1 shikimate dehydrogenase [Alicyclobacillus cycloheptanicus]